MRVRILLVVVGVAILALGAGGCNDHWNHGDRSNVVVRNDSACDLRIFIDGYDEGIVHHNSTETIRDVGDGHHVLEAMDGTRLIERRTVDLQRGDEYYWRIDSCAR